MRARTNWSPFPPVQDWPIMTQFFTIFQIFTEIPVEIPDDIQVIVTIFDVYRVFSSAQVLPTKVNWSGV